MDEESCEPAQCGVYALQRHTARPLRDPGLTVDLCINSFHGVLVGNERPGQGVNEEVCSPDFVETRPWSRHSLGLFYFGGLIFFFHMQGSKTSVFIKDILFFRLEKITKKGRTNKSLQRRRRPTTCSPWVAILNWFRALPAAGSLRAAPAVPAPSLPHGPCTTHFIPNLSMGLFYPSYFFPSRPICRVLSSLRSPSAGCSILYPFDALIFPPS